MKEQPFLCCDSQEDIWWVMLQSHELSLICELILLHGQQLGPSSSHQASSLGFLKPPGMVCVQPHGRGHWFSLQFTCMIEAEDDEKLMQFLSVYVITSLSLFSPSCYHLPIAILTVFRLNPRCQSTTHR